MSVPRRGSLLVIFLTVFIDLLGFGLVLPLVPLYGKDFAAELGNHLSIGFVTGSLMACFSTMQFLFSPLWGRLSDRIGRRPVLMIGLAGSVVFYTLFGLATVWRSLAWLFVSRIGAGIAGATIATAQAYIADTTTLEGRAKGMALVGAAFGLGFTFGPLLGALAFANGGQVPGPAPGYLAAGLSAVALVIAWFKLPESLSSQTVERTQFRGLFDGQALRAALGIKSVAALLVTLFLCIFSFANFESTLSVFVKESTGSGEFSFRQLCLTFAYVGFVLTIVQGGIVRRVAGRVSEVLLASIGIALDLVGFPLLAMAGNSGSQRMIFLALTIIVTGFAFVTPSLNSLISRRSDPSQQGEILGIAQSISSLSRILGPMVGLMLFHQNLPESKALPLWLAAAMMALSIVLVQVAGRTGHDYPGVAPDPRPE